MMNANARAPLACRTAACKAHMRYLRGSIALKASHMRVFRSSMPLKAVMLCLALGACSERAQVQAGISGDVERGRLLLRQYGCGACHQIPGVAVAEGHVGPPLKGIARRVYLAGVLTNTPQNMIDWIRSPQSIDPLTAMPDLQVPEPHAQDMVAYLYTLR